MKLFCAAAANRVVLAFIVAATMGCANLAPVKTFADETKKVAATFDPLAAGTIKTCESSRIVATTIATERDFNAAAVATNAKELCKPIAEGNKAIEEVATLLEGYADVLAGLADEKLPNYKEQFSALKSAVNGVQINGAQIIPKEKVAALTALGELVARLGTQKIATSEAKKLLDQQAGFDAAVDALNAYVQLIYLPSAKNWLGRTDSLAKSLTDTERKEPLAARVAKVALEEEAARARKMIEAAAAFEKAAVRLKAARGETRAGLDDKKLTPQQLLALIGEVRDLRKQLVTAF